MQIQGIGPSQWSTNSLTAVCPRQEIRSRCQTMQENEPFAGSIFFAKMQTTAFKCEVKHAENFQREM